MKLEAVAHELVALAIARNASRIVELDRMVDILKRMFPQQSERNITAELIREVSLNDGAVAWLGPGPAGAAPPNLARKRAEQQPRHH